MFRTLMLIIAAVATLAPTVAVARKPLFGRSFSRPAAPSGRMASPSQATTQTLPTAILQNPAEMTRRFGPSVLERASVERPGVNGEFSSRGLQVPGRGSQVPGGGSQVLVQPRR